MTSTRRFRSFATLLVTSLSLGMPNAAPALKLQRMASDVVETRDGVVVPTAKVTSPDLPTAGSGTTGPYVFVADAQNPRGGGGIVGAHNTFNVIAQAGDAPGASLCVKYRVDASASGTVTTAPGNVDGGIADPDGFSVVAGGLPPAVTAPTPLQLTVTPSAGPVRVIFSEPPATFTSTTGDSVSISRTGRFAAFAGDIIRFDIGVGASSRANAPNGAATSQAQYSYAFSECAVAAVPTLSTPLLAGLALLLAALTAFGARLGRRQRARSLRAPV